MRILIIDSNIVISGLIKDGLTRQFLIDSPFILYAPETLISEIRKYEQTILDKSGLSKEDFGILFDLLIENIIVVSKEEYQDRMEEAEQIIGHIDKKDVPFIALALSVPNDGIWSDDEHFLKQDKVTVFTTSNIVRLSEKEAEG